MRYGVFPLSLPSLTYLSLFSSLVQSLSCTHAVPRRSYVRISSYPLLNDTALYREDTGARLCMRRERKGGRGREEEKETRNDD